MGRMLIPAAAVVGLGAATGGFGLFGAAGAAPGSAAALSTAAGAASPAAGAIGAASVGSITAAPAATGFFGSLAASLPSWATAGNALSALGVVSSLASGVQGYQGAEFLQDQYEEESANAKTTAAQDELQRRRQLNSVLASQRAIFASRGVELFGGSQQAIQAQTKKEAEEDIETSRTNYLSRSRRYGLAANQAQAQGTGALLGGVGGAAKSLSGIKV